MRLPAAPRLSGRAFTLVEMVAAVAVLALLLAIILGIVNSASKVADNAFRAGDSSEEATQVLDRIGADIAGMIVRPDVDQYYLTSTTSSAYNQNEASSLGWSGSDEMFFYSQTPGYFGTGGSTVSATQQSPTSLIGYRISTSANASAIPVLERVVQGMTWNNSAGANSALPFLTFSTPATSANPSSMPIASSTSTIAGVWSNVLNNTDQNLNTTNSNWHVFGSQVFRIAICFQLRDGSFTLTPPTTAQAPALSNSTATPLPPVPGSINDTTGMVVAIALLDTKSRQLIPATSWSAVIAALKDPTTQDLGMSPYPSGSTPTAPTLMSTTWNNALQTAGFAQSVGIPQIAASQIAVYQRFYPLNTPIAK